MIGFAIDKVVMRSIIVEILTIGDMEGILDSRRELMTTGNVNLVDGDVKGRRW